MKNGLLFGFLILSIAGLDSCKDLRFSGELSQKGKQGDYYGSGMIQNQTVPGRILLKVDSYQQTTDSTCGPSAILTLLRYYGGTGNEMAIAAEMGTSATHGTTPDQMANWLNSHGFNASWHENGTLDTLRNNLGKKVPTLVEWSDWGGHWVLVVGYDTRNTAAPDDDVILFADPYDRHDDNPDGTDWFNAGRFYYMWYDARLFGRMMTRIYIDAEPTGSLPLGIN
ncbi:MAG: C39 family peptidase [Bacteroidota bacterium]